MKKRIVFGLLLLLNISTYSQNLDLVVTESGDSIAGKIDNISDSIIYFQIKSQGSGAQPDYPNKYPGKLNLEKASLDELNFYLKKVKKTKKTGAITTILGSSTILTGLALMSTNKEVYGYVGFGMSLFGSGITIIGLPFLITGSSRVKSINEIKRSRGMTMEFIPGGYYNFQAQNYQPGVKLRIRF